MTFQNEHKVFFLCSSDWLNKPKYCCYLFYCVTLETGPYRTLGPVSNRLSPAGRFWSWEVASDWPESLCAAPAARSGSSSATVTPWFWRNSEKTSVWTASAAGRVHLSRWTSWTGRRRRRSRSARSDPTRWSLQVRSGSARPGRGLSLYWNVNKSSVALGYRSKLKISIRSQMSRLMISTKNK